jgi:DNA-binding Xre family transcriptional regulator
MQNKTVTQQQVSEIVEITPKNIMNNMEKLKEKKMEPLTFDKMC